MGWTTEYGAALDARLGALYEQLERIAGGCNAFDLWVNDGYKQGISTDEKATYLTYGEVCGSSIAQVLIEGARATADDVFLDLGAGSGRVVMAAAMLGMEAIGVEIVPSLVALSRAAATKAADRPVPAPVSVRPHAPEASHHPRASFYHGDFLQLAWWRNCFSDATAPDCADACSALPPGWCLREPLPARPATAPWPTIVFVGATKWGPTREWPGLMHELGARLMRLPLGTRVIVTAQLLEPASAAGETAATPVVMAARAGAAGGGAVQWPVEERGEHARHRETSGDGMPTAGLGGALQGSAEAPTAETHRPVRNESGPRESALATEVSAVEIWCRELPTSWGTEVFRVYELRRLGAGGPSTV